MGVIFMKNLLVFAILCGLSTVCCASVIQMGVTVLSGDFVSGSTFGMDFSIVNSGDEPAHDVQATLSLPEGFSAETAYVGLLAPNAPSRGTFNISVPSGVTPGVYPVFLKIHYKDANAYPVSTVSPAFIRYVKPAPTLMRGQIAAAELAGKAEASLSVQIDNLDAKPHTVLVRLHMPDEIKSSFYSTEVSINAKDQALLSVPIKSLGALPGSTYQVFASMNYESEGLHYGSTASGIVKIVEEKTNNLPSWLPISLLLALIVAFVILQFKGPRASNVDTEEPVAKKAKRAGPEN
jgi:hypothetical protein